MINISPHALLRLQERLPVAERKIQKLVQKAWASEEPLSLSASRKQYNTAAFPEKNGGGDRIVKQLMGYTFIFYEEEDTIGLVTVI
jgi:hypothetical protein